MREDERGIKSRAALDYVQSLTPKAMEVLLTDEEIGQIIDGVPNRHDIETQADEMRAVVKAQLKKVVKLLDERKLPVEHGSRIFVMGEELWQALLKECE